MGAGYRLVQWNQQKKKYDLVVVLLVVLLLSVSVAISLFGFEEITQETLIIRSSAITAFVLLHIILSIGPLARMSPAFLVLLYNRRHLGVIMFLLAAVHGIFSLIQFHSLGNVDILTSLFTSNVHYGSFLFFPFQVLGFTALLVFALMATTSHDFWLKNLTPKGWKALHRLVYVAYLLILFHVFLGTAQGETSMYLPIVTALGFTWIVTLHFLAFRKNRESEIKQESGFVEQSLIEKIELDRAITVNIEGQAIAIFKTAAGLEAVSNSCKHQGGPIGEGKIVDGCITCPWHGYQYYPHNGCSPPPFDEKLTHYHVMETEGGVQIDLTSESK